MKKIIYAGAFAPALFPYLSDTQATSNLTGFVTGLLHMPVFLVAVFAAILHFSHFADKARVEGWFRRAAPLAVLCAIPLLALVLDKTVISPFLPKSDAAIAAVRTKCLSSSSRGFSTERKVYRGMQCFAEPPPSAVFGHTVIRADNDLAGNKVPVNGQATLNVAFHGSLFLGSRAYYQVTDVAARP